jgi:putative endonuclease
MRGSSAAGLLGRIAQWLGWRTPDLSRDARALGWAGERAAARMLKRAGYRILARNVKVQAGEADLIALDPDRRTIVIVEVKTRLVQGVASGEASTPAPIPPEVNITGAKRAKLMTITRALIRRNAWQDRPVRIDVVAVEWPIDGRTPSIRHHQRAVTAG